MDQIDVFVPKNNTSLERSVKAGSGIVGSYDSDGAGLRLDYEGNIYNTPQLANYADRVAHAAGRHIGRDGVPYPTVARVHVLPTNVIRVGSWDGEMGEVRVEPGRKLDLERWLGHALSDDELQASGYRWEMARRLRQLEAENTPESETQANWMRKELDRVTRTTR